MATYNTLDPTSNTESDDTYLLMQNGINRLQARGILSAALDQGEWQKSFGYNINDITRGTDGKRYVALESSGSNTANGVVDPITGSGGVWFDCTDILNGTSVPEKATTTDVQSGTDDEKYVTPLGLSSFPARAIGEPFAIFDHLTGSDAPDNSGTAKYIKLTAGEGGAGGFNEGLLINETTTGSGATVEITAEIATGPMSGQIVNLVNSEKRHIAPGETSGATHNDQMQLITGEFPTDNYPSLSGSADYSGAFTYLGDVADGGAGAESEGGLARFDSSNSPGARTGDKTDVKRIEATYHMRIV